MIPTLKLIGGLVYFLFLSFGDTSLLVSSYASLQDCHDAVQKLHDKALGKPEEVKWFCVEAEKKDEGGEKPVPVDPTEGDGI